VWSVFCGQAEPARAQQVAVARLRIPSACTGRAIWPAVQVSFEDQRGQAGVGVEVADRVVLGDLADRIVRKPRYGASAARSPENGIAFSSAPRSRRAGACFRVRDAAIAQPAQSFTQTAHGCAPPAGKSAKRAESPLTFAS
jgi:hypothetical protein